MSNRGQQSSAELRDPVASDVNPDSWHCGNVRDGHVAGALMFSIASFICVLSLSSMKE